MIHAMAPTERFWRLVQKVDGDACWEWRGYLDKDGYGSIKLKRGKIVRAHRFSYELHNGPIPAGMLVRHSCNNPPCCNPSHLQLGNHADNMQDRLAAGRYPRGERHPMTKFSDATVAAVRIAAGRYVDIAKQFGMSATQVGNIKRGEQRKMKAA